MTTSCVVWITYLGEGDYSAHIFSFTRMHFSAKNFLSIDVKDETRETDLKGFVSIEKSFKLWIWLHVLVTRVRHNTKQPKRPSSSFSSVPRPASPRISVATSTGAALVFNFFSHFAISRAYVKLFMKNIPFACDAHAGTRKYPRAKCSRHIHGILNVCYVDQLPAHIDLDVHRTYAALSAGIFFRITFIQNNMKMKKIEVKRGKTQSQSLGHSMWNIYIFMRANKIYIITIFTRTLFSTRAPSRTMWLVKFLQSPNEKMTNTCNPFRRSGWGASEWQGRNRKMIHFFRGNCE